MNRRDSRSSNLSLFRHLQGIIHLDAQIAHSAFYLGVAEKQLNRPQILRSLVDECRFGSSHGVCMGYVEPEAKMQNEGLMSTKIRSFKYGEGVLASSANNCHSRVSFNCSKLRDSMRTPQLWLQRITKLGLVLIMAASMSACSGLFGSSMKWKEEVLLHDGKKLIVERMYNLGG